MVGVVAGGVLSVLDVDGVVRLLLDTAAHEPAVALLCRHTLNQSLLRREVVGDGVHRVGCAGIGEYGLCLARLTIHRVGLSVSVNLLILHIDTHKVGLERLVGVLQISLIVDIYPLGTYVIYERVGVLSLDNLGESGATLLSAYRVTRLRRYGVTLWCYGVGWLRLGLRCESLHGAGCRATLSAGLTYALGLGGVALLGRLCRERITCGGECRREGLFGECLRLRNTEQRLHHCNHRYRCE